jgi:hypothetical protein
MADYSDESYTCPVWAPLLGFGGCAFAVALSSESLSNSDFVSLEINLTPPSKKFTSLKTSEELMVLGGQDAASWRWEFSHLSC